MVFVFPAKELQARYLTGEITRMSREKKSFRSSSYEIRFADVEGVAFYAPLDYADKLEALDSLEGYMLLKQGGMSHEEAYQTAVAFAQPSSKALH